ncbi:helix-turn-helix transcriptional regulator [[Clostridium] scindens]|uniref:Helix-turn-helix transcriptional regulator n=2 Tax=Clostridium scindens (strain JCM 10418 / VPI 12708) TaxID=29347 RepID=A0A844F897_CLOSV|nr:helix-turn-helix transcriptional regulator [[Clostridium] scindens]
MNTIMKTGQRIREIRKAQGITQNQLAEKLHVSPSFISRIENGSSSLTVDFSCEIADALHVVRQEIFCDLLINYQTEKADSISQKIELNIKKFPTQKQDEILAVIEFLASRLS